MDIQKLLIKWGRKDRPQMSKSLISGITGISYPIVAEMLDGNKVSLKTKERAYNGVKSWLDDKMSEFMEIK